MGILAKLVEIWLAVVNFFIKVFTGGYGVVANYVMIGVVILIILAGAYWKVRSDAIYETNLANKVAQLEDQVKNDEALVTFWKNQADITNQVLADNQKKLQDEIQKNQEILDFISGKSGATDEVPDIIKQFFEELQKKNIVKSKVKH